MDAVTGEHTNTFEYSWYLLKHKKKRNPHFSKVLLPSYLSEFIFRQKFLKTKKKTEFWDFARNGITKAFTLPRAISLQKINTSSTPLICLVVSHMIWLVGKRTVNFYRQTAQKNLFIPCTRNCH